jgi:hypothetical protein
VSLRQAASISAPMWRQDSAHSSFCSASTAPASRMMASRPGKMPTTSVRRHISLLRCSFIRLSRAGRACAAFPLVSGRVG